MRQAEDLSESQCSTGYVTLAATIKVSGNNGKERVAEEVMESQESVMCQGHRKNGDKYRGLHWAWLNISELYGKRTKQTMVIN